MSHIGRSISHTANQIARAMDACIAAQVSPELTGMRGMVLGYIIRATRRGTAVYQRDIETRFRIRRSSVTAMLQGLEQAGFIERASVEQDARLKSLTPTEKGLACFERIDRCISALETRLQQNLTEQALVQLQSTLEILQENACKAQEAAAQFPTPEDPGRPSAHQPSGEGKAFHPDPSKGEK